jgi:hypothetical protein
MPTCSFFDRRCPPRKRFGQIEFHSRAGRRDDRKNPTHAGFSLLALTMHSQRGGVFANANNKKDRGPSANFEFQKTRFESADREMLTRLAIGYATFQR